MHIDPHVYTASASLLRAASAIAKYIDRAEPHDLAELDAMLAEHRASWVEVVNVSRAANVPEAAAEALSAVAVFTDLLDATRACAARLTA